jgi:hypothetical protein
MWSLPWTRTPRRFFFRNRFYCGQNWRWHVRWTMTGILSWVTSKTRRDVKPPVMLCLSASKVVDDSEWELTSILEISTLGPIEWQMRGYLNDSSFFTVCAQIEAAGNESWMSSCLLFKWLSEVDEYLLITLVSRTSTGFCDWVFWGTELMRVSLDFLADLWDCPLEWATWNSARPSHLSMAEYQNQISNSVCHCCRGLGIAQPKGCLKRIETKSLHSKELRFQNHHCC